MIISSNISIFKPGCNQVAAFIAETKAQGAKKTKDLNSAVSCMKAARSEVERQLL
jgi:hypothetical protein